ncbi:MAG: hypothetical protein AABX98_02145 [Nanoarchaeota archaeon]
MKRFISTLIIAFLLLLSVVAAEQYTIDFSTTPEKITARDNPFAHYDDLGELPELAVTVKDSAGQPAKDISITVTVTHVDDLILPSGFPWVQGKELFSVTSYEEDGALTVDGLLFPLRGEYTVDVTVMDWTGNSQKETFTVEAAEPFKQSTWNGIIFVAALGIFGFIVGLVFGKDLIASKKAQGKMGNILGIFVLLLVIAIPFTVAHSEDEIGESGIVHYEDSQVLFYTNPEVPDIGAETYFTVEVKDENGMPVNNAIAQIELANEEEGFVVLETAIFSQTGTFTFQYGIFDGAPHLATVHIEATEASSYQFVPIEREYAFAGEAHNPPFTAKLIATAVMLLAMLVGFAAGVAVRACKKSKCSEGEHHE